MIWRFSYGDFKNLARGTALDKVLHDKAFNTVKNRKYDGCQRGLASMIYKFFDKKSSYSELICIRLKKQQN